MTSIVKKLAEEGMIMSLSEGRRLVNQGAITLDDQPVMDSTEEFPEGSHVVCVGKKVCKRVDK